LIYVNLDFQERNRSMKTSYSHKDWTVLLIGGSSGTGKTFLAKQSGLRLGISWLEVDDLRLALQRSRVMLPEHTEALYFFEETPHVWELPAERLRDALIAVGQVMAPALEVVIENHIDTAAPVIIEGDGILPSLLARPPVRDRAVNGNVRAVFLVEPEEDALFANMMARNRGIAARTEAELRTEARAKWLFGRGLADEASHYGLPVVEPRPWLTLLERVMMAVNASSFNIGGN
jgi:2-phosphoglycerate kinase